MAWQQRQRAPRLILTDRARAVPNPCACCARVTTSHCHNSPGLHSWPFFCWKGFHSLNLPSKIVLNQGIHAPSSQPRCAKAVTASANHIKLILISLITPVMHARQHCLYLTIIQPSFTCPPLYTSVPAQTQPIYCRCCSSKQSGTKYQRALSGRNSHAQSHTQPSK